MEDNYIHFSIDGRDLKIHKENPEDIQIWRFHWKGRNINKPYWRKLNIRICKGYKKIDLKPNSYYLHRVNYYAWNQDWDIYNSCIKTNSIDHEDRNKTNNNINNLRVVTNQQNHFNRNCKGYSWYKQSQKWMAYITVNGKRKHLGYFLLEEEARQAYLEAKKIYHKIE